MVGGLVGAALYQVNADSVRAVEPSFWLLGTCAAVGYGGAGAFLAAGDRAPAVRRVLLGIGLCHAAAAVTREYSVLAAGESAPLLVPAAWLGSWLWAPAHLAIGALLPLLLPDGRLLSPRWRPAFALAFAALGATAAWWAVLPYDLHDFSYGVTGLRNPVGIRAVAAPAVDLSLLAVSVAAVLVALASVVLRWRRSTGTPHHQLTWVLLGVLATLALFLAGLLTPQPAGEVVAALAMLPLPAACAVAVVRHRLWDIDVALSRSLIYSTLSAVVVATYVVVVGVLGAALGAGTGASIVATVAVALLVLPLHGRLQKIVNHLVHGEAEDPYTALAQLGERLGATTDPAEVAERLLPEVVARIAELLRSTYAAIELSDGAVVEYGVRPAALTRVPLEYGGTEVGALSLANRETQSPGERRRLAELARQAAVAVHSVLLGREVQRSRHLAVTAREEERRRVRRDLHDGMGPALAALALQAETARDLLRCDPAAATVLLDRLVPRLKETVEEVRTLVHDLRPPMLDDLGLAGALRELASRFAGPHREVRVDISELGELPAAVDVAAYRIVAEALSNAARHAEPGSVTVAVHRNGTRLHVEVTDDGLGLDPAARRGVGLVSMRERAEELDGQWTVTAVSGGGTTVAAWLPVEMEGSR